MALDAQTRVQDILIHVKDRSNMSSQSDESFIGLPFTKYDNVMGRPRVAPSTEGCYGAPFMLITSTTIDIDEAEFIGYFQHIR